MKKWSVLGFSVAALVTAILFVSLAPAFSQGGESFVLCEKNGKHDYEKDVDEDPVGEFSAGDRFLFSEPEYDNNGKRIGKSAGQGVVIRTIGDRDALVAINVSLNLQGGRLEVQSAIRGRNFGKTPSFSIVGGTGRFAGAGGSITINERAGCGGFPKGDKLRVELR